MQNAITLFPCLIWIPNSNLAQPKGKVFLYLKTLQILASVFIHSDLQFLASAASSIVSINEKLFLDPNRCFPNE